MSYPDNNTLHDFMRLEDLSRRHNLIILDATNSPNQVNFPAVQTQDQYTRDSFHRGNLENLTRLGFKPEIITANDGSKSLRLTGEDAKRFASLSASLPEMANNLIQSSPRQANADGSVTIKTPSGEHYHSHLSALVTALRVIGITAPETVSYDHSNPMVSIQNNAKRDGIESILKPTPTHDHAILTIPKASIDNSVNGSDFRRSISAKTSSPPSGPPLHVQQIMEFNLSHRIGEDTPLAPGYKDGGRQSVYDANDGQTIISSKRESVTFKDPSEDPSLKRVIDRAKVEMAGLTSVAQKAEYLNKLVDTLLHKNDPDLNEKILRGLPADANGKRRVSLGDLIDNETGVCRHRTVLFKVLADNTGIPCAMVRGNFRDGNYGGGHAWNEVVQENGKRLLVDVMHGKVIDMSDPYARHYQDIQNRPMYDDKGPIKHESPTAPIASAASDPKAEARKIIGESPITKGEKEKKLPDGTKAKIEVNYLGVGSTPLEVDHIENNLKKLGMQIGTDYDIKPSSLNGGNNVISLTEQGHSRVQLIQSIHQQEMSRPQPTPAAPPAPEPVKPAQPPAQQQAPKPLVAAAVDLDLDLSDPPKAPPKTPEQHMAEASERFRQEVSNPAVKPVGVPLDLDLSGHAPTRHSGGVRPTLSAVAQPASVTPISSVPLSGQSASLSMSASNGVGQMQSQPLPHNAAPTMGSLALAPELQVQLNLTPSPQQPVMNPAVAPQASNAAIFAAAAAPATKPEQAHLDAASQAARTQLADTNYKPTTQTTPSVAASGSPPTGGKIEGHTKVAGSGVGVGMGVYGLSQKFGEDGTAAGDLRNKDTRTMAQAGIAADGAAILVDTADSLSSLKKVSDNLKSASKVSRVAAPVGVALSVASGVIDYKIADKTKDAGRASDAIGGSAGGIAGAAAGGIAGAKAGAAIGAAVGVWFGGIGAAPGAAIGGFVGGIAGAIGGAFAGSEAGKKVAEVTIKDSLQKKYDEEKRAELAQLKSMPKADLAKAIQKDPTMVDTVPFKGSHVSLATALEDKEFRTKFLKQLEAESKAGTDRSTQIAMIKAYEGKLEAGQPAAPAATSVAQTAKPVATNLATPQTQAQTATLNAQYKSMSTIQLADAILKDPVLPDTVAMNGKTISIKEAIKDGTFRDKLLENLEKLQAKGQDYTAQIAMLKAYDTKMDASSQAGPSVTQVAQSQRAVQSAPSISAPMA